MREMEISADEKHGMKIDAEEEEKQHATAEQNYFESHKPNVALLWSKKHDRGVQDLLISMLKGEGFRLNDDRGEWRHFRYVERGETRRSNYRAPRLPFNTLKGCHPLVYLCFIDDFAHWKGDVAAKEAFRIEIEPVGNDVTDWEDGIFPCSWKNEKHVLWYKYNTLDLETLARSYKSNFRSEYEEENQSNMTGMLNRRESAIEDVVTLVKFDEGADDNLKRCRVVCLWDVRKSCVILSHQLSQVMQDMGFEQEEVVTYRHRGYSKQADGKQVGFPNISLKSHPWLYKKQAVQSYKFPGKAKGLVWLPHPNMLGCHPLIYLHFLQNIENFVGRSGREKRIDIRSIPIGLLDDPVVNVNYAHTVWKEDISHIYNQTCLLEMVLEEIGLNEYMIEYGIDALDVKEYYQDFYCDTGKAVEDMGVGTDMIEEERSDTATDEDLFWLTDMAEEEGSDMANDEDLS